MENQYDVKEPGYGIQPEEGEEIIVVEIDLKTGNLKAEVIGQIGTGCQQELSDVCEGIGHMTDESLKDEAYEEPQCRVHHQGV